MLIGTYNAKYIGKTMCGFVNGQEYNIDIDKNIYGYIITGVKNLTRGAHFKSYIDDLLKIKGAAFNAMGIGIDFIGELKDGNGVLGAAILAAGHFATYKVVETMLLSFMINPSIIAIAGVTLLSIFVTSAITTYIDRKIC